jgi:hypothetical protein
VRNALAVEESGKITGTFGREMPKNQYLFFHRDDSIAPNSGQEP